MIKQIRNTLIHLLFLINPYNKATPLITSTNLPCQLNCITVKTEYDSISKAGNLPNELAMKNVSKLTLPTAAAKLIRPEGINGIRRSEKMR